MPTGSATRPTAAGVVAGDEPDLRSRPSVSSATACRGIGPDRVGDQEACRPAGRRWRRGRRRARRASRPAAGSARSPAPPSRRRLPTTSTRRPSTVAADAQPGPADRTRRSAGSRARPAGRGRRSRPPAGARCRARAEAARSRTSRRSKPGRRHDRLDGRPAQGQRAGLVEDDRVDPAGLLEGLGAPDQDPGLGRPAGADHDRRRRGQAHARTGRR